MLQGVFAVNASLSEPEVPVKQESKPPIFKPERPPEPVSKWTLADYENDDVGSDKCAF